MHLRIITCILTLTAFLLVNHTATGAAVTDEEVAQLIERINSVEKVEQLYSIRYAVGKYAELPNLSLRQQELLMKAMTLLSDEFKIRRHFRNAADVYKEYLDYNNKYLESYNAYAKDSLMAVHRTIAQSENATIQELDAEIAALTKTRAAVSGLKTKYYSFGSFGAIAVVVLTVVIALSRNRAINAAEAQIHTNRERLKTLNKQVTEAGMAEGTVAFCKETAATNLLAINSILESINTPDEKKLFQKDLNGLQQAEAKFNQIIAS